jgi:hypothetical protein
MDSNAKPNELTNNNLNNSPKSHRKLTRKVSWRVDTVDNELMGKKKYDCSNIYKFQSKNIEQNDTDVKLYLNSKECEKIENSLSN